MYLGMYSEIKGSTAKWFSTTTQGLGSPQHGFLSPHQRGHFLGAKFTGQARQVYTANFMQFN